MSSRTAARPVAVVVVDAEKIRSRLGLTGAAEVLDAIPVVALVMAPHPTEASIAPCGTNFWTIIGPLQQSNGCCLSALPRNTVDVVQTKYLLTEPNRAPDAVSG